MKSLAIMKMRKMTMSEIEQLRRNTEKAYQAALKAMFDLVDAITEERNYYRELCRQKEQDNGTGQRKETLSGDK